MCSLVSFEMLQDPDFHKSAANGVGNRRSGTKCSAPPYPKQEKLPKLQLEKSH